MKIKANKFLEHGAGIIAGTIFSLISTKIGVSAGLITHETLHSPLGLTISILGSFIGVAIGRTYMASIMQKNETSVKTQIQEPLKEIEQNGESFDFFKSKPPKMH